MKKPNPSHPSKRASSNTRCSSDFTESIRGVDFSTNPWRTRSRGYRELVGVCETGNRIRSQLVDLLIGCGSRSAALFDSPMFRAGDFSDPSGFAKKLRAHTDPVSKYVWGRFSTEEKKDLTEKTELVREIVILQSALNRILATGPIHNATRFAKVVLSDATLRLLRSAKTGIEVLRLNRLLLEDAYPDEIAKLPNCDRQVGCESPLEYRRELLRTAIFACNLLALPFACKVQDADLAPFEEGWPVVLSAAKERAGEWKKAKERVGALRAGEKHPARHDARIGGEFADFVNGWIDFALILFFRGRGASYALTGAGLDHLWKIVEASFELMLGFEWQDHPVVMQQFRSRNFWVAGDNRKWEKCSRGHKRDVVRDKFEGAARTIKSRLQRAKGSDSG